MDSLSKQIADCTKSNYKFKDNKGNDKTFANLISKSNRVFSGTYYFMIFLCIGRNGVAFGKKDENKTLIDTFKTFLEKNKEGIKNYSAEDAANAIEFFISKISYGVSESWAEKDKFTPSMLRIIGGAYAVAHGDGGCFRNKFSGVKWLTYSIEYFGDSFQCAIYYASLSKLLKTFKSQTIDEQGENVLKIMAVRGCDQVINALGLTIYDFKKITSYANGELYTPGAVVCRFSSAGHKLTEVAILPETLQGILFYYINVGKAITYTNIDNLKTLVTKYVVERKKEKEKEN